MRLTWLDLFFTRQACPGDCNSLQIYDGDSCMTTQPQSESQCMSVVAYQGQKDVLEAIINLERRTFPKADSWAGEITKDSCINPNRQLCHLPAKIMLPCLMVVAWWQLGCSTGIMCHEVKRHNTTLLFASKEGKVRHCSFLLYAKQPM